MAAAGAGLPVAERLYYNSAELEFTAVVTDIRLVSTETVEGGVKEQLWQVALDRTAFYPESGGQPWDTGVLQATARSGAVLDVRVEEVEEDEATGEVWHSVRKPLVEGTEVVGRVDFARRVDHEQQHSGQHLLSAMFLREVGARTISFHLGSGKSGEDVSTIDLTLREGMDRLSPEELAQVEEAANRVVYESRPLMTHFVEREFAEEMLKRGDLRKLPDRPGRMRIVQMQGIEFNACGGTHVANTGAIGAITIRRVEKVRQGWRVEFCCGMRAVRMARRDYGLLGEAAGSLSVGMVDVPGRTRALLEEIKGAGKEKKGLLEELAGFEAARLLAEVGKTEQEAGTTVLRAVFAGCDVEFCKRVVSHVAASGLVCIAGSVNGAEGVIAAGRPASAGGNVGRVLREVLAAADARGGGSAEMAQGVCRGEQVQVLIEAVGAALRGSAAST